MFSPIPLCSPNNCSQETLGSCRQFRWASTYEDIESWFCAVKELKTNKHLLPLKFSKWFQEALCLEGETGGPLTFLELFKEEGNSAIVKAMCPQTPPVSQYSPSAVFDLSLVSKGDWYNDLVLVAASFALCTPNWELPESHKVNAIRQHVLEQTYHFSFGE